MTTTSASRIEHLPRVIALLLCDDVREPGGGKRNLLGVFGELKAPSFPKWPALVFIDVY